MGKEKRSVRDALKNRTKESAANVNSNSFGKRFLDTEDLPDKIFYKPEVGKNAIDIIPFVIKSKNHPKLQPGDIAYVLDLWVHKKVGAADDNFLCLKKNYGKPCPICEELETLQSSGADEDDYKELKPNRRVVYNIIDKMGDDDDIKLFESSHFLFEKELIEEAEAGDDGEFIVFADLEDGKTIKFKGVEESFKGRKFTKIKKIIFEDRDEAYDEDILDKAYSLDELLIVPTYDEVQNAFLNKSADDDDDDEKPVKKSDKKAPAKDDDDDDDDEKPAKKPEKKKPVDDDDDDDDEKPVKKSDKKPEKTNKCPAGETFGKDCDEHDECDDCDLHDACAAAEKEAKKATKKPEKKAPAKDDDDED